MADRERIVYVINSLEVGGAEVGMCRLVDGLDRNRYDVMIVALDGHEDDLLERLPSGPEVLDLQIGSRPRIGALREFGRALWNADVIVGSLFHSAMIARLVGVINRDATIATWHHNEEFKTRFREIAFSRTLPLNDVVLADSEPVADVLYGTLDTGSATVHTVPIAGIDVSEFEPREHEPSSPVVVGGLGRIAPQKNFGAVLKIADRLPADEYTFEIAGDGPELERLRSEAAERDLSNVTFHGRVDNVPEFLSTLDVYVQPSCFEGLCITVLEAMAAGLPVVGSDVGGIGRNVGHGESGFLCKPDDVEGFVSRIEVLAADAQLRQRFGNRGRAIVDSSFTQDALVHEFEDAIK